MTFEAQEINQVDVGLDLLAQQIEDKFLLREQFLQLIENSQDDVVNILDTYLVA